VFTTQDAMIDVTLEAMALTARLGSVSGLPKSLLHDVAKRLVTANAGAADAWQWLTSQPGGDGISHSAFYRWAAAFKAAYLDRLDGSALLRAFTIREVAGRLMVSQGTVRKLVKSCRLPTFRIGRQARVPAASLAAFLAADEPEDRAEVAPSAEVL
jgi:excisionase family DNA binding protein